MKKKIILWSFVKTTKYLLLVIFTGFIFVTVSAQQAVYYVSPKGKDSSNGLTVNTPFATLTKVRDVIRSSKGTMTGDIIINVMAGDYFVSATIAFTNLDAGNNGHNVIYKNYDGIGSARFIGGAMVTGWSVYKGNIYRAHIGANLGIYTLYENGIRADMARYPKKATARAVSRGGYMSFTATPSGTEFTMLDNANYSQSGNAWDPTGKNFNNAWVYGWVGVDFHRWTSGNAQIVSASGNSIRTVNSGGIGWPNDHLLVEHCLDLLEWPGEYYYDKTSGYLYYYSRANGAIENQEIIAPKIVRMIGLAGSSATTRIQNIQFIGLTFMGTDRIPQAGAADWNCTQQGAYDATVYLSNAKKIVVKNCRIAASGINAVTFGLAADTCTVDGCLLEHSGFNGVLTTPTCTANTISNSLIRYAGELRGHGRGVCLTGGNTENSLLSHLSIYFTARAAVSCSNSGGSTFEYIAAHDNVQDSGDQGAFYFVDCPALNPNRINQCTATRTYCDFSNWDRSPTGFYNDRNAAATIWSNCDAGDRVATGAGDHQWYSFRHDPQVDPQPILFNNCSWNITYATGSQYSNTANASFSTVAMQYSQIGITSAFPIEYNDLATKPTMPVGLWIQKGNAQAMLRWTQADRATSYTVKRASVSGGPYMNVGKSLLPTKGYDLGTQFLNTGLSNDSTYYYIITASNDAGESDPCVELSVKPDINGSNALTGTVIGNTAYPGNAFDNNLTTVTGSTGWVGLDLGTAKVITALEYTPTSVNGGSVMTGGMFQGANDAAFTNPVTLFTVATSKLGALTSIRIPQAVYNKTAFRYVRFYKSTGDCTVAELKFFGHSDNGLAPIITNTTIDKGRIGVAYSYSVLAINMPSSYKGIGLPAGLNVNTTTGVISGTPTKDGTFPLNIIAINAYGSDTVNLSLKILPSSTGDLIACYPFDKNAADSTANKWDATLMNDTPYAVGKIGGAVSLDGVNDYVSLPAGMLSSVSNMTISTWVNPNAISTSSHIFDFGIGTSAYMFLTPDPGTGKMRFTIRNTSEQIISSISALATNVWTHVAVTLSGNTGTIYVNGIATGTNPAMSISPSSLGVTTLNYIGRSQFATDPYFNGLIDDFRIYGRALTSAEIFTLSNAGISGVNDIFGNGNISFYPNPVEDIIHIQNSDGATIQIYSAFGTMLHVLKITEDDQSFDLSKLSNGIYFIKLIDKEVVKSAKIIKI